MIVYSRIMLRMGWRLWNNYDEAEREREREWIASLPRRERIRFRLWQVCGTGIVVCIFLLMLTIAFSARGAAIEPGGIEVIDGDTIRIGVRDYRLVGFDTPEARSSARCERERTLAAKATSRLRQLVSAGGLDLERVPCACPAGTEGTPRCNYGRFCGILKARGRDVSTILIAEGLARPYVCSKTGCPKREGWCGQ